MIGRFSCESSHFVILNEVKNLKIELKMYIQLQILHFVQNDIASR